MVVNGKAIFRSAADELYHLYDEDVTFETKDQVVWYAWTEQIKTIAEVKSAMAKLDTAKAVVTQVQQLAPPMDGAPDIFQEYWDVVSAEGAFTDEDVSPLGITAAQLGSCVTVIEAFNKLMVGDAEDPPAMSAYHATINTMRRVNTGGS